MENIRTLQQSILWVADNHYEIVDVKKSVSNYGPFRIAVLVKNETNKLYEVIVFLIDWNNYFYNKRHQACINLNAPVAKTQDQKPPMI